MLNIKYAGIFIVFVLLITGCAGQTVQEEPQTPPSRKPPTNKVIKPPLDERIFRDGATPRILVQAEAEATPAAAKLLATAREMTVDRRVIVRGGCWDYIDRVWSKAGYPIKKRVTVFKHKKTGPYANVKDIRGGDWLYFINHSYKNTEHSAMFVAWADRATMQGYVLSYAGQRRKEPARYKIYDLSSVYQITRPRE